MMVYNGTYYHNIFFIIGTYTFNTSIDDHACDFLGKVPISSWCLPCLSYYHIIYHDISYGFIISYQIPLSHHISHTVPHGTRLAFDPTPMVSHMTLPPFWGRVECEKVAFLAAKRGFRI